MGERIIAKAIDVPLTKPRTCHDLRRECLSRVLSSPGSCQGAARNQQLVPRGVERDAHNLECVRIE
jgi:hypothetical protein